MHFEQTFQIDAPTETVWAVMSDLPRYPQWALTFKRMEFPAGETLAPGLPVKLWVTGAPTATWTVTRVTPGESYAWESKARGVHTVGDHRIEREGDTSRVTLSITMQGLMARLFAPMIRGRVVSNIAAEGDGLKARAEARRPAASAGAR